MSLKSNALISLKEFKEFIQLSPDDKHKDDAFMETLINAASQYIETYCRCKFITPSAEEDEVFDGNGTTSYYVMHAPLVSTISAIYYWDGSSWTAISSTISYDQDKPKGILYFTDGHIFAKGERNWKVSYTYGYAISAVPTDLKIACAELAALKKKKFEKSMHGIQSESFGDQSVSYNLDSIPDNVKQILNTYKRYH